MCAAPQCARAARRAGVAKEVGLAARFWDLFEAPKQQSADESADWRAAAADGRAFALHNVAVLVAGGAPASTASRSTVVQRPASR